MVTIFHGMLSEALKNSLSYYFLFFLNIWRLKYGYSTASTQPQPLLKNIYNKNYKFYLITRKIIF